MSSKIEICQLEKALNEFEYPPPLTAMEKDRMRHRKMKKHDVAIMLVHWFNAFSWLFMLTSGAALIISSHYQMAPNFFIHITRDIFGAPKDMLQFHIWLGVMWILVFSAYTIFGYRRYLRKKKLHTLSFSLDNDWKTKLKTIQCILFGNTGLCLDENDIKWLIVRVLKILGKKEDEELPPQGAFNGGQKLFGLVVALMTPVIMFTGLVMAFHLGPLWLIQWAIPIHFIAVGMVVSGLMIHIYMGAILPEEKPAFFSMLTGNVSELFLYRHHFNFWKERIVKQCEWMREVDPNASIIVLLPDRLAAMVEEKAKQFDAKPEAEEIAETGPKPYWNPYIAGALLGLLIAATYFLLGRGVGASSALSRLGVFLWGFISPEYVLNNPAWGRYVKGGHSPLLNFMIFEVIGVIIGGYISGRQGNRIKLEVIKGPGISNSARLASALFGGIFMGLGARIARGCTSGLALTGGATLAVGGWVFMMAIFATGFIGAYFFRRLWL